MFTAFKVEPKHIFLENTKWSNSTHNIQAVPTDARFKISAIVWPTAKNKAYMQNFIFTIEIPAKFA